MKGSRLAAMTVLVLAVVTECTQSIFRSSHQQLPCADDDRNRGEAAGQDLAAQWDELLLVA